VPTIVVLTMAPTVTAALTAATAADAGRLLYTYYDDATGERTDLSAATLSNWVAKTANLLTAGLGLGVGDVAVIRLPPHWQSAAVLLGCWSAGLSVDLDGPGDGAVAFVAEDSTDVGSADETYALALAPLGLPFRAGPPAGMLDYVLEVRGHGDHFSPRTTPATVALVDGTTHGQLAASARALPPGARVLVDGDQVPDPVDWLVAPLLAGCSVVLCRHPDHARLPERLAAERAVAYPS
jgi:uncharacterized protein (TIGR03089 family)